MTLKKKSYSARWMALIRQERRDAGLCWHCGGKVATKIDRFGQVKKLKTCAAMLLQAGIERKKKGKG